MDKFIVDFYKNFSHLKETPLVLYGIGQYTRRIIEQVKGFRIVGLMDARTTGQTIYGLRVLAENEAALTAQVIIIVANLSIAGTIYCRIAGFAQENGIKVYYLNGLQPQIYDAAIANDPYWDKSEEDLKERISENEVISFDIFDTLLMRRCQMPEDVFSLVAYEIGRDNVNVDFAFRRKVAEKTCFQYVTKYFNIEQIYDVLQEESSVSKDMLETIMNKEMEIEKRLLVPRKAVCDLLRYAKGQGKTVILTSDMYLGRDVVRAILEQNNVCEYDRLLISCEEGRDKYWGSMWEYVKELYPDKRVLHIGDNKISDEKTPREHGIESYRIANANEILRVSGISQYIGQANAKGDGLLIGMFASRAANNPFGMNKTKGRLYVPDMYEFGYLFFGPLILQYLLWLIKKAMEQHVDTILFVARDGYLLEKLYQKIIGGRHLKAPCGKYYLSSRRASSVASIETEEDIWFVFDKLCNTATVKYEKILEKAFGVGADANDIYLGKMLYEAGKEELFHHTVERYGQRILENAKQERINYFKYLETLQLGESLGFVNFVCRGVTQYCTSKMIKKRIKGFYFASEEDIYHIYPHMEDIFCLYGENVSTHTSRLNIVIKYLYGETIVSAPDGQLICFSEEGKPIYEPRSKSFARIRECHNGVEKYIDDMIKIIPDLSDPIFSNELIDRIWGMFGTENVILSQEVKETFSFEDYYGE
ncbi:MAG: haloacid dehalogenase [Lachnospiraceae bacterium]|nr:haloacid dehalogenase [Butyrivibrio sp.]MCM1342419.1 hypothetical protein [Muribaculaceae bacterium]MCM1410274.1 haloacid dehalogenase [Lachnospiraceae bacterium]